MTMYGPLKGSNRQGSGRGGGVEEVDKNRMGERVYVEDNAYEFGLINVYAYHCYRCNYTWLPKAFDFKWRRLKEQEAGTDGFWGHDLFYREPPKSCARCKSRSWKELHPRRRLKLQSALKEQDWIDEDKINDTSSPLNYSWINSVARLRALNRQGKLTPKDIVQF